jgi:uncharacterized membrane protein YqjE
MSQTHSDLDQVSTGELVGRLSVQLTELVRAELRLAQTELRDKGKRLGVGAGMAGAGAVLAWFAVGALVCAAISGLALVLPVWASALIVTAVLLLVAGVLGLVAKKQATEAAPMVPQQAVAGVHQDLEAIKGGVRR